MNKSALKASFTSVSFSIGMYKAMVNTAKKGYSVEHVVNRKGQACIAVRYNKLTGFTFTDKKGLIIPTKLIYSFLREV